MSLPAYAEYKDSGVEWLGDVPKHWQVTILKYNCSFSGGGTPSKEKPEYWGGDIPWVSPKDMKVFKLVDTEDKITKDAILESSTNMVKTGALLMVVRSGILQRKIPIAINFVDVTLNQDMKALRFKERIFAEYFSYLVMGHESKFLLLWLKQGATVESIEHEYLANSVIPWPSIEEQTTIARFLDHETAKIDALIAEQQRLIELLKEKRQAVISHAVTKGLDPNAPMKDSGVAWLGDVPEHWRVKKFKNLISCMDSGTSVNSSDYPVDSDDQIAVLKTSAVYSGSLDTTQNKTVVAEDFSRVTCPLRENSLIVSRMNTPDLVGAAGYSDSESKNIFLPDRLWQVDFFGDYARFMHFFTLTKIYRLQINLICAGTSSSMQNISQDDFKNIVLCIPPEIELNSIFSYIDQQTAKIDELINHAHQGIDLLKERRSALISAAVTGKIDVRGWQVPQQNLVEEVQ